MMSHVLCALSSTNFVLALLFSSLSLCFMRSKATAAPWVAAFMRPTKCQSYLFTYLSKYIGTR